MQENTFTIENDTYRIYCSQGTIIGKETQRSTHVSGGGGRGFVQNGVGMASFAPITSSVSVHDKFFIREADGKERPVELVNWNINCRDGHALAIIWVIKNNNPSGSYVGFKNFTTGASYIHQEAVSKTAIKPKAILSAAGFDGAFLLVGIAAFISAYIGYTLFGSLSFPFFLPLPLVAYLMWRNKKTAKYNAQVVVISMNIGNYLKQITQDN